MKRCPQCNRVEADEQLSFCRSDGTPLVTDFGDEAGTARLGSTLQESATRTLPHTTDAAIPRGTGPTTVLPSQTTTTTSALGIRRKNAIVVSIAVIALFLVLAAATVSTYLSKRGKGAIESIAVLPFENRSGSSDTDYLSDGLADSLIYRLSQLPNLKVSPTSSVIRYKGQQADVSSIANALQVDAVMYGRLMQHGEDLSISVQLIDSRSNKLIWAEQYERKMSDLLATQREIAASIVQKLQPKLAGNATKAIDKHYTESNEAYQLYLKGRFYWNKRDEANMRKAIEQFKAAAEKDSNFALAFVGLSDSYILLPFYSSAAANEVLPPAKAYAERALAIDDSLGEAHASLGYVHRLSWNWVEMEREFKRAIELSPNYATAHKYYGNGLGNFDRLDEALAEYKKAQELEPLSLIISANIAEIYLSKGDFNAALEQCLRAIELDPNWYYIRQLSALAFLKQGRVPEAVAEIEKSVQLSNRRSAPLGNLGYIYAQIGKRNAALELAEELKKRFANRQANGYDVARVYLGLGDKDQMFEWLEKDFQSHNMTMPGFLYIAPFDVLRDDPRFKDLTRRIGVTPPKSPL